MKHRSIAKSALFGAITFALAQPALAVSDEEFNELKEQFNLLAEQVDENSESSSSNTTIGGYGEMHYNNLKKSWISTVLYCSSTTNLMTISASFLNLSSSMPSLETINPVKSKSSRPISSLI